MAPNTELMDTEDLRVNSQSNNICVRKIDCFCVVFLLLNIHTQTLNVQKYYYNVFKLVNSWLSKGIFI